MGSTTNDKVRWCDSGSFWFMILIVLQNKVTNLLVFVASDTNVSFKPTWCAVHLYLYINRNVDLDRSHFPCMILDSNILNNSTISRSPRSLLTLYVLQGKGIFCVRNSKACQKRKMLMLAVEHAESAPITLWWIQHGRSCGVVQEAVTFLGSPGTKSLSGLQRFHAG